MGKQQAAADGPFNIRVSGARGPGGSIGLPPGGTTGQALRKDSGADDDASWQDVREYPTGGTDNQVLTKGAGSAVAWEDPPHELPAGGTTGQRLAKSSNDDYEVEWIDPPAEETPSLVGLADVDVDYIADGQGIAWDESEGLFVPVTFPSGGSTRAPVVTVTGTGPNLEDANEGSYVRYTAAGAVSLTVRPDSTEALTEDGEWHIRCTGAGGLTLVEGSGVTINLPSGGTLVLSAGMTVTLKRVAEDEFDLLGQTVPA